MSDFLAKLAGRTLGFMPVAQTRGESLFAPPSTPQGEFTALGGETPALDWPVEDGPTPAPATTLPSRRSAAKPAPSTGDRLAAPIQERMMPRADVAMQKDDLAVEIEPSAASLLDPSQARPRRQSELAPLLDEPAAARSSAAPPAPSAKTVDAAPPSQPSQTVASHDPQRSALVKQVSNFRPPVHEQGIDQTAASGRSAEHELPLVPMPATFDAGLAQQLPTNQQAHGVSSDTTQNNRVRAVDSHPMMAPALPNNKAASAPPTLTIQITIGRVEVRAVQPTPPARPRPATPAAPALSLEAYLRGQKGG